MFRSSRRDFLLQTAGGAALAAVGASQAGDPKSPNEKLNVACVGVANRGAANLAGVAHENVVALCDVDERHLEKAKSLHPKATTYADYREMLSKHPELDAVVVATPDHTHAVAAIAAMKAGKHVYCEKPLAHTVREVRTMREVAAAKKLVTQMGTQIHAGKNYRRVVDVVRSGALGAIDRVHVYFSGRPKVFPNTKATPAPKGLAYDLWLGPVADCPYVREQSHFDWRYWWRFGNGVLGDFGCHFMDLAFWALDLRYPTHVVATGKKDYEGDNDVPGLQKVDYHFPARGDKPAVHLTWYHGGWQPEVAKKFGMGNAVHFIGKNGELAADYSRFKANPAELVKDLKIAHPTPDSIGHHREWLQAIRTKGPTTCNFDYSGALAEAVLLGNVAFRAAPEQKLTWDAEKFAFEGSSAANAMLHKEYRKGWEL